MTCEEGPSRKTLSCCGTESGEYSNHLDFMCVFFHPLPPKVLPKQKLGGKVLRGGVSQTSDEAGWSPPSHPPSNDWGKLMCGGVNPYSGVNPVISTAHSSTSRQKKFTKNYGASISRSSFYPFFLSLRPPFAFQRGEIGRGGCRVCLKINKLLSHPVLARVSEQENFCV
ncbi:MAG: hypothetical protein A2664_02885 [Candidatus Taylorbacteria bacterium RIFCSPHIGHO2_01_FULL_46_22b]|uniref:Uncharacterized protein n=1 Tax=Candidatus Taylorbacteria bacterium RIFCSPHIGHO2_01_FULL_46_22b TaxID=1802301 RepID=A0A1G2M3W2_9BACT|nr:MAG: hypothetical protein A2664_02885 [Candidatus Taylorbacteria bacterium RIFCSPHIGHO2_01_FULL_46_22b]